MKKEIEGWSYNKNIEDFEKGQDALRIFVRTPDNFSDINASMVKAVVELPEKKIQLTESEFDNLFEECPSSHADNYHIFLKKKLFNKE